MVSICEAWDFYDSPSCVVTDKGNSISCPECIGMDITDRTPCDQYHLNVIFMQTVTCLPLKGIVDIYYVYTGDTKVILLRTKSCTCWKLIYIAFYMYYNSPTLLVKAVQVLALEKSFASSLSHWFEYSVIKLALLVFLLSIIGEYP